MRLVCPTSANAEPRVQVNIREDHSFMMEVPIHRRLATCLDKWVELSTPSFLLDIISNGYRLQWVSRPPKCRFHPRVMPLSRKRVLESLAPDIKMSLEEQVKEWKSLGIVSPCNSSKGIESPLFAIPKRESPDCRPILDLRFLNKFTKKIHFQMDNVKSLKHVLRKGDWAVKLDLEKAYWHLMVEESHRRFLRFWYQEQLMEWNVLMFGLTDAPRIFTMLLRVVAQHLRSRGIRCIFYLDDILIVGDSFQSALQQGQFAVNLLQDLGFKISKKKSVLRPTQELEYLGLLLDLKQFKISIPEKRRRAVRRQVIRMLNCGAPSGKEVASVLGKLRAMSMATNRQREKCLFLQKDLTSRPQHCRYSLRKPLSLQARQELEFWKEELGKPFARPITPVTVETADFVVTSDSSSRGWGAWTQSRSSEFLSEHWGLWRKEDRKRHITFKETKASVLSTMQLVLERNLSNIDVLIRTDNLTSKSYLLKRVGKVDLINFLMLPFWDLMESRRIRVLADHIKGLDNHWADRISRLKGRDKTDWRLKRVLFIRIQKILNLKLTVDLFASEYNRLTEKFCSLKTTNALQYLTKESRRSLAREGLWANPPFCLIPRILSIVRERRLDMVMLIPFWSSAFWWPVMMSMLTQAPIVLPRNCLLIPQGLKYHQSLRTLKWPLLCVRLSGHEFKTMSWRKEFSTQSKLLLDLHMSQLGEGLPLGLKLTLEEDIMKLSCKIQDWLCGMQLY